MSLGQIIILFVFLMFIICGVIIFVLHRVLVSSTEGAVRRLSSETEEMRSKQKELNQKIKEADEELAKRKKEAEDLAKKMIFDAEEKAKEEREKIVKKAREEGEEIIAKAQSTRDKMKKAIEVEVKVKMVDYTVDILSKILSDKARGALNDRLMVEFLENLSKVDMAQIGTDIDTVDIITAVALEEGMKQKIIDIIKGKLGREIKINATIDEQNIGGVVLRFGSLALDGSLREMVVEAGIDIKKNVEDGLA